MYSDGNSPLTGEMRSTFFDGKSTFVLLAFLYEKVLRFSKFRPSLPYELFEDSFNLYNKTKIPTLLILVMHK